MTSKGLLPNVRVTVQCKAMLYIDFFISLQIRHEDLKSCTRYLRVLSRFRDIIVFKLQDTQVPFSYSATLLCTREDKNKDIFQLFLYKAKSINKYYQYYLNKI